ncbi:MAG: helix-turn-helix domain-containing protein [Paraburkholderia sp.]|uniref:helix-turn-helix domain-containing protein n=1 Tax=Paraburkholderia sp. TaxID=1926495 RepID=UPI00121D1170|nr:helix-turn-helix domain-containing protein [Paraburkholderia sp.]TAM04919.1 MAG: helix-turn-helix domain-containing protein [Paraburkholderia sp.]TAM29577.1 MAG: helix-turn-helix domain-containing protein [Paraburkholderia sp.]
MEKTYSLTLAQAARRLGVSYPTARQWAVRGDLPCHVEQHEGFCVRTFNEADLDAFAARRAAERTIGADELTAAQAAHIIGQRWPGAASQQLKTVGVPFRKIGARLVFPREAVEAYAAAHPHAGWFSISDVIRRFRVPRATVERWADERCLPCERDHRGRRRFRPEAVAAFRGPARSSRDHDAARGERKARQEAARQARLNAPELGASDAARFLGYASPISVWRLASTGKLPFILDDRGHRRFARAALEQFKEKNGRPRRGRPYAALDSGEQ